MSKLMCWLGFHKWEAAVGKRLGYFYAVPKCRNCDGFVWQVARRTEKRLR